MKLLGISIQGFRSFIDDSVLHVPKTRGLYYVTGDNRRHPEISPNGVGKSTIWDALCWALYGKSTRKLQGPDLAAWGQRNDTMVAVDLEIRGVVYGITRIWYPRAKNVLTLQAGTDAPEAVEQSKITELLGVSYETFLSAVLVSQFGSRFLDLKPTGKLDAFAAVLGLDAWLDCSDRAKAAAADAGRKVSRATERKITVEREIAEARAALAEATAAGETWEADHAAEVARVRASIDRVQSSLDAAEQSLVTAQERRADTAEWIREAEAWIAEQNARVDGLEAERARYIREARDARREADRLARQIEGLESLGSTCPTCHGPVDDDIVQRVVSELRETIAAHESTCGRAGADATRLADTIRAANTRIDEREAGLSTRRTTLRRESSDVAVLESNIAGYRRSIESECERLAEVEAQTDPTEESRARHDARIRSGAGVLSKVEGEIGRAQVEESHAEFWRTGFRDLRLWVCEQAMQEFEAVMYSAMEQLGLRGWDVAVDIEGETKGGSISRGFTVKIRSPDSGDAWVPWEAWCGGETGRLALAGEMAFGEVACSRAGIDLGFEIWDEPTKHLSAGGVRDLLACLGDRARRLDRQVFLVDHTAMESGVFAGSFRVVLDEQGSRIESDIARRNPRCDQYSKSGEFRRRYVASLNDDHR